MDDQTLMRRVADALRAEEQAEQQLEANASAPALSPATQSALVDSIMQGLPASPRPRRARVARVLAGSMTVLAAAAVLLLSLRPPTPELPDYSASPLGGDRTQRSSSATGSRLLSADSQLHWVLQPAQPVVGDLTVHTFYRNNGLHRWHVPVEISEQGAVRIRGRARELGLPPGRSTLFAVIGRREDVPPDASEVLQRLAAPDVRWRVVSAELEVSR